MAISPFPSKKPSKRCQKCSARVDCLIEEFCYIERRRLEKLNTILRSIATEWRKQIFYTRPRVLLLREIIAFHKFELQFSGSRPQRRNEARQFIIKFGKHVISDWEFGRSNSRPVFRLRY
jgi:hypothetical protein